MLPNNRLVAESQYLPPIEWFIQTVNDEKVYLNEEEKFVKSTTRNRCFILGANGIIRLTIPILKGRQKQMTMKDVMISYDSNWQKIHWQSISSAYGKSPFFMYYRDNFEKIFHQRFEYLIDLNYELLLACFKSIQINKQLIRNYTGEYPAEKTSLSPIQLQPYSQVFQERFDFTPNLSIIDLLFNLGPDAKQYLETV